MSNDMCVCVCVSFMALPSTNRHICGLSFSRTDCTHTLPKFTSVLEGRCQTKVDDLHIIHLHVFFQKNVFRFQISVDNALLVTIVDATQEVIDQLGSILFCEFGALNNFIE